MTLFYSYILLLCGAAVVLSTHPSDPPKPQATSSSVSEGRCPSLNSQQLLCLKEWACQHVIRLDLRCLLSLNGNPLLGGVLNPLTETLGLGGGGVGGGSGGAGGGILGGLLGG